MAVPVSSSNGWATGRPGFFLPVRVLSRLFRRLFLTQSYAGFDPGITRSPVTFASQPRRQRALRL